MTIKSILLILLASLTFSMPSFAMENAFYILRHHTHVKSAKLPSFSSLTNNSQSIHLLISQAYYIKTNGSVGGFIHPDVIDYTKKKQIKLFALVTNASFDNEAAHLFLSNKKAQRKALLSILAACKKHNLAGVQFDFEGVSVKDKSALTHFYQQAYQLLHKNGYLVSFAIVPIAEDGKQATDFLQRKFNNWGGAYDLKALSQSSDFITIMSYDQHTSGTTPGPTANIHWVEATIQYALKYIPANKISLGIPTYSGYWYIRNRSNGKISVHLEDISYNQAAAILEKAKVKLNWDNENKINYAFYQRDWMNEYLFVENSESFKAKLVLAEKYHLRGISVFSLGNEDPTIWSVLRKPSTQLLAMTTSK